MTKFRQHNTSKVLSVPMAGAFSTVHVAVANVLLAGLCVALFIGYLAMNNRAAAGGFTIRSLEHRVAALRDEQKKLDLDAANRQALENIESKVGALGLVPVTSIQYVNVGGNAVAIK